MQYADREAMALVNKAADSVKFGDVKFITYPDSYYWVNPELVLGNVSINLYVNLYRFEEGLKVRLPGMATLDEGGVFNLRKLLDVAEQVIDAFNANIAEAVAEAKKREEEAEAKAAKEQEEREGVLADRRERLLTEFLDEKGRIRARRSRSYQPVIVRAELKHGTDDEYEVHFEWINDHDIGRERRLANLRSFDVKVGSRYKEVFDDGPDDLPEWHHSKLKRDKVVKYDGELRDS